MSQIEIETFLFFFTPPPPIRTLSQRGYLVSKLIMHGWHFHFLFMAVSNIFLGLHVGISIINLFTRYPLLPFFLVTSPLTLVSCIPSKGLNYEAYNLTLINATYFQNYLMRGWAQSSPPPPLKSTYLLSFDNLVFKGAEICTKVARIKKN